MVFVVASIEMPNGDTLELRSVGPKGLMLYILPKDQPGMMVLQSADNITEETLYHLKKMVLQVFLSQMMDGIKFVLRTEAGSDTARKLRECLLSDISPGAMPGETFDPNITILRTQKNPKITSS